MAQQNKTQPTNGSIKDFIAALPPEKQDEAWALIRMMEEASGEPPVLWGSIIGFGTYQYKYASGREGEWMKIGFSPRKTQFSLYLSCDVADFADDLAELGEHSIGKGCLYIKRLSAINVEVLKKIITAAYAVAGDNNKAK